MSKDTTSADIGLTGLGVMGQNVARNLASHDFTVAVHNRHSERAERLVKEHGHDGDLVTCDALTDLVAALEAPRVVIVMVAAGEATDAVIDELSELLDRGDVVVDAGNANFADTARREQRLAEKDIHLLGTGVSGGEEGALRGPSIMPGGSDHAWKTVQPFFEAIAADVDGVPCTTHVGPGASGHFVKMVHNGIEYADMQLIGEVSDLLGTALGAEPGELAKIFAGWNDGELGSFLIEITADVLGHVDAATGQPFVEVVADEAEQKGTGRWTVQAALDLGVPVTGIAEAIFARSLSGHVDQRRAVQKAFADRLPTWDESPAIDRDRFVEDVRRALYASKIVAYAQGFDEIVAAGQEHDWDIDPGAVASIWRGGCIIRARLLDRIREAYDRERPVTLLAEPFFADAIANATVSWRRTVAIAAELGVPTPVLSSSLAYFDALRRPRLSAALIQGLRDNFGAHTYHRTDREGTFHTLWAGDRTETEG